MLKLFTLPIQATSHGISLHKPDIVLSVMPRSETSTDPKSPEFHAPKPPDKTKHRWIEVHDSHYDNHDLSEAARSETRAIDIEVYGPEGCFITEQKMIDLMEELAHIRSEASHRNVTALIHCHGGVSRSQAASYALLCLILGRGRESEALELLLSTCRLACPNPLMTWHIDRIMKRGGAMSRTIASPPPPAPGRYRPMGLKIDIVTGQSSLIPFFPETAEKG